MRQTEALKCGRHGNHRSHTRCIVGNSGAVQFSCLRTLIECSPSWEHRVNMCADGNDFGGCAPPNSEDVADFVDPDIIQYDFFELGGEPFGPGRFAEGRGRNARKFHLPNAEFRPVFAKPLNGGTHLRNCS